MARAGHIYAVIGLKATTLGDLRLPRIDKPIDPPESVDLPRPRYPGRRRLSRADQEKMGVHHQARGKKIRRSPSSSIEPANASSGGIYSTSSSTVCVTRVPGRRPAWK